MVVNDAPPEQIDLPSTWIPTMVERLVTRFCPERVILFGSHARGEAHEASDVDLLVVMPDDWGGARKREAAVAMLNTLRDLPVFKDVVVTTPEEITRSGHIEGTVVNAALTEGQVLYDAKER
jgi:uncharacterized protein